MYIIYKRLFIFCSRRIEGTVKLRNHDLEGQETRSLSSYSQQLVIFIE